MSESLVFEEPIIYLHDDLDPWAGLTVGFNDDKMLVVELSFDRYEEYRGRAAEHWCKHVIIDQKGIDTLLYRMHVPLTKLPMTIAREFGEEGESWSVSDVLDTFNAILSYLERQNIHFRIEKEYEKRQ